MKVLRYIVLVSAVMLALACTEWAIDSTEQGWDDFEDNDFSSARSHFNDAIGWDPTYPDAYNGLGWCDLLQDCLTSSLANFDSALHYESNLVDASAGAAIAATEVGEHSKAVARANDVISADPSYEFSHYSSVDIDVIHLVLAKSAAALGDFDTALDEIKEFDADFDADPSTVLGQDAILRKLEDLMGVYGAWLED